MIIRDDDCIQGILLGIQPKIIPHILGIVIRILHFFLPGILYSTWGDDHHPRNSYEQEPVDD